MCRGSLDHGICCVDCGSVAVARVLHKANTAQISVSEWEENQLVDRWTLASIGGESETWAFKVYLTKLVLPTRR